MMYPQRSHINLVRMVEVSTDFSISDPDVIEEAPVTLEEVMHQAMQKVSDKFLIENKAKKFIEQ